MLFWNVGARADRKEVVSRFWHGTHVGSAPPPRRRQRRPPGPAAFLNDLSVCVTVASLRMSGRDDSAADATGTQGRYDWFRHVVFLKVDKPCAGGQLSVCLCVSLCVCMLTECRNATVFLASCLLLSDHLSASRCLLDCCCVCVCVCVSYLSCLPFFVIECENTVPHSLSLSAGDYQHMFLLMQRVVLISPRLHVTLLCSRLPALCVCVCVCVLLGVVISL